MLEIARKFTSRILAGMITRSGRFLQIPGKKWCTKCNEITDQTCFHIAYWKSEKSDDAYEKSERWNCNKMFIRMITRNDGSNLCARTKRSTQKRRRREKTGVQPLAERGSIWPCRRSWP